MKIRKFLSAVKNPEKCGTDKWFECVFETNGMKYKAACPLAKAATKRGYRPGRCRAYMYDKAISDKFDLSIRAVRTFANVWDSCTPYDKTERFKKALSAAEKVEKKAKKKKK